MSMIFMMSTISRISMISMISIQVDHTNDDVKIVI